MGKAPIKVGVTGAAGQIAYSLLPNLVSGAVFGQDQPVVLSLLDVPPAQTALAGVVMELYPLMSIQLRALLAARCPHVACQRLTFYFLLCVAGRTSRYRCMLEPLLQMIRSRPSLIVMS